MLKKSEYVGLSANLTLRITGSLDKKKMVKGFLRIVTEGTDNTSKQSASGIIGV